MLPCHGRCQVKLKNGNASAGPIHWWRPNFPFPRHDVLLLQSLVCKENKQPSTSHTDTTLYTCNVEKEKKGFNNGFSTKTFGNAVKLKLKKKRISMSFVRVCVRGWYWLYFSQSTLSLTMLPAYIICRSVLSGEKYKSDSHILLALSVCQKLPRTVRFSKSFRVPLSINPCTCIPAHCSSHHLKLFKKSIMTAGRGRAKYHSEHGLWFLLILIRRPENIHKLFIFTT